MRIGLLMMVLTQFLIPVAWAAPVSVELKADPQISFTNRDVLAFEIIKNKILKIYPPDRYYYIFVGRSLTMVRALMDLQDIPNTGLPFSGKSLDLNFGSRFGQELQILLREHLDIHLPNQSVVGDKELVLLDYTSSGVGLLTALKALNWYYDGRERIHLLRVAQQAPLFFWNRLDIIWGGPYDRTVVLSEDSMELKHIINSNFDSYAGYGSFSVDTGAWRDVGPTNIKRYQALKKWIVSVRRSSESSRQVPQFCAGLFQIVGVVK